MTAIQTSTGSQYLRNGRVFGTPNKIEFARVRQLECNSFAKPRRFWHRNAPLGIFYDETFSEQTWRLSAESRLLRLSRICGALPSRCCGQPEFFGEILCLN
jgi:hypothetical protein